MDDGSARAGSAYHRALYRVFPDRTVPDAFETTLPEIFPELSPGNFIGNAWRGLLSPYQSNPLDINPLRTMLDEEIDFGAIAAQRHRWLTGAG